VAARTVHLTGVMTRDPATGAWRVYAFDTDRGTRYYVGAPAAGTVHRNLRDLIVTGHLDAQPIIIEANLEVRNP
jgi:hypothetical protein